MQRVRLAELIKLAWSGFETPAELLSAPRACIMNGSALWKQLLHLKPLEFQHPKESFCRDKAHVCKRSSRSITVRVTRLTFHKAIYVQFRSSLATACLASRSQSMDSFHAFQK